MYKKFKLWFLNEEEKDFIKKPKANQTITTEISLVQCPQDIDYLYIFQKIISSSDSSFHGILPNYTYVKFWQFLLFFPMEIKRLHHYLQLIKWNKLFAKLGIITFHKSSHLSLIKKLLCFKQALVFYFEVNSKQQLLNHAYCDVKCGDLIYDSFLRFNETPTVNIKNPTLLLYIYDCYCQISYYKSIVRKFNFKSYYTSYSSYISHGVPVRVFLNAKIEVNSVIFKSNKKYNLKTLTFSDNLHVKSHWNYKRDFQKFKNPSSLRKFGYDKFKKRFDGENDLTYMKVNPFNKSDFGTEVSEKIDGVIFLHDFVDSPHGYRNMVFEDFYEWIVATLNYFKQSNLIVGIKPHPNQRDASKKFVTKLKIEYHDFIWISESVSNNSIFNSGIKFGISVHGTVLAELAYHRVIPICCGDNPASSFNFIFEAKNKNEYFTLIDNLDNLKFEENLEDELGEYYYMNYMHN